ncbi:MAG: IS1182 family transposase [Flavobacteriales bacterium]|jgi:transposase|nr:IS1182 family transposase [Flavobacteriales bacterium]
MQGKKDYQEKLFTNFQLSERIPEKNFYRKLKEELDLRFLYKRTNRFYGDCGQKSIDPVVFYKLCLVGYLENIISDRHLIDHCTMRMDILYFLDYDIDDTLPWHSTVSRTRNLFPEQVFEEVFTKVFKLCVNKGMVSGHTQAIDAAPVKANASMDSLELKVPKEELKEHLKQVRYMSTPDREEPRRKSTKDKSDDNQKTIQASVDQLNEIKSRNNRWKETQDERPGANRPNSKYTSNKTHYSPSDPDARISVKPGKSRKLNYACQMGVDSAHHVISHIEADYADKKDNQSLEQVTRKLKTRLQNQGLLWQNLLADTGYSSGENYEYLEKINLVSYIPPHGTYKGCPDGFIYDKENNRYACSQGKYAVYRKTKDNGKGQLVNHYATTRKDCRNCPIASSCKGKSHEKRFNVTYYREEYERGIARVKSKQGVYMKRKRHSTVEPVFGTLTQFMGLRKINTRGIANANKVMLMAGTAYNIKKYLKFIKNDVESVVKNGVNALLQLFGEIGVVFGFSKQLKFIAYND